jgi:hypothetical protein
MAVWRGTAVSIGIGDETDVMGGEMRPFQIMHRCHGIAVVVVHP